jgi:hypothetical protein
MPDRLSLRSTLLLVALAFGVAFAIQVLLGGGSSAAQSAAKQSAPGFVANAPGAQPDLSLTAAGTVPALRDPRQPRKRRVHTRKPARKKKPSVRRVVKAAPTVAPAPVMGAAPVLPTPTAAPRYIPPAPRRSTPAPRPKPAAPKPKPAPTSTPQASGEFDSSGES